jgi:twitching motility protein PilT
LLLDGALRPIVKSALTAAHVSRLAAEIAPPEHRQAIDAGGAASFTYEVGGRTVEVEVSQGPKATVRPARAAAAAPPQDEAVEAPPARPEPVAVAPAANDDQDPAPVETSAPPSSVESSPPPAPASEEPAEGELPVSRVEPEAAETAGPSGDPAMDALLRKLVESGGSDLHVSSTCRPMIRTDGEMAEIEGEPVLSASQAETLLFSIAPERNREQFRETGDTDFAYEIEGLCRFRSNLFKDRKGTGGVFRIIPSKILTVDDLNLAQPVRDLCFLTKGLVLVTGPTGSGKSTTLCALVDHVNENRRDHVITIEDPIEFVHQNKQCLINQREVHVHTEGFKPALRAALREDPDVVLVGELRDLETVAIAIETAETGHLVFGTLHTTSAMSTVDRIIDQFPADQQEQIRTMLAESLKAVIAQVLCRKIGGGRIAALEVLLVNSAVSNLIREGKTFQIPSIMQTGKSQGNVLLNAALLDLVQKKLVEPEEAYSKAADKTNLLSAFEKHGIKTDFLNREERKREPQPA